MKLFTDLTGIDAPGLISPWRLALGLSILCLPPIILALEWAASGPLASL
jgi:hypothetical protein